MALAKQFSTKLDRLWKLKTGDLRALVIPKGVGQPPKFSVQVREQIINGLLNDATELLVKREGHVEFQKIVLDKCYWHIKGHGLDNRFHNLIEQAEKTLTGPIIYTFWSGGTCLYVGKGESWRRLLGYAKSIYLQKAQRIKVFRIKGKSELGKAECLATHFFEPRDNKKKPAKKKWGKACPICRKHDRIRSVLKALFKMK